MTLILNKNAILTGHVDSVCLACEAHLRGDEDAVLHIVKPVHKKNLEATSFLEKYKDDRVRKVKKGYYCEYCNIFMKTAAKVGPHVIETKHCERKALQPLKREGNGVLAFDKVFISENAWHGLSEDTCSVCDAEFDNALLHKTETAHILNLVLAEIEIADGNVYRKVDDSTFQCLTCNLVWALNDMKAHFDGPDHKTLYQECCDATKNLSNEPKKETREAVKENNQNTKSENGAPKDDSIKKKAEKEISKEETKKAPEPVKVNTNESKKKPEADKKPDTKKEKKAAAKHDKMSKIDKEICEALGAEDYIALNANGGPWCILCDWSMDRQNVQSHLKSKHHLSLLKMHRERAEKINSQNDKEPKANDEPKSNEKSEATSKVNQKSESNSKIVDAAAEFQKNDIKLDFVNGSAYCRVCSKSVDYDFDIIKNHIDEHKKSTKQEKAKKSETLKAFPNSAEKTSISLVTSPVRMNEKVDKPKQNKEEEPKENGKEPKQEKEKEPKQVNDKEPKQEKEPKQVNDKEPKQDKEKEPKQNGTESKQDKEKDLKQENGEEPKQENDSKEENEKQLCLDSEAETVNYAKENKLVYNKERNTSFCPVCVTRVPPALKNMKEHINGASHRNKVAQIAQSAKPVKIRNVLTKVPTYKFIDNVTTLESIFYKDIIVNDKYCLNIFSFLMITKNGMKMRCQACEVNLTPSQLDVHKRTARHERVLNEAPVVSSEESEFIRECRPNVYHCGFCNQLESPWSSMESHLKSTAHREAKTGANWRLQVLLPAVRGYNPRRSMEYVYFNRMLLGHMFEED